jgi:glyoxylase-like metal-dependent hydrolase (beta-lactamase superfamily II)
MINSIKNVYTLFKPDYEILPGHGPSEKVSNISKNNIFVKEHIYD